MNLISVPAFQDNYIWLLIGHRQHCVIIDPGCAAPVQSKLLELNLIPDAILLSHHHNDHTGGVLELQEHYPQIAIFGPEESKTAGAQHIIYGGERLKFCSLTFNVLSLPGHTAGHVAYFCSPYLFCGDTLFSAGCGRLYQQAAAYEMYHSLQQIAQLPDDTQICCAHEYTLNNLLFAQSILPNDPNIGTYLQYVKQLREKDISSLPNLLQFERSINLFLRCHDIDLQKKLGFNTPPDQLWQVFSELRQRKDTF